MLIFTDKSTHEEHLSQPLQTTNKQYKKVVTSLTGYNVIFNITDKNHNLYFTTSINDDDFNIFSILVGAYKFESLDDEIKRNVIEEG